MNSIFLYGDIGVDNSLDSLNEQLLAANNGDVNLNVFSYGGNASVGIAMHTVLEGYKGNITAYIDGVCASAGTLPLMAANKIVMPKNGLMMIHNCWLQVAGDSGKLRNKANLCDTFTNAYRQIYVAKTGKTITEVSDWMAANNGEGTWFTAEEALRNGFVDEIGPPVKVQAHAPMLDLNRFGDFPDDLRFWGQVNIDTVEASLSSMTSVQHQPMIEPSSDSTAVDPPVSASVTENVSAKLVTAPPSESEEVARLRRENSIRTQASHAGLGAEQVQALVDSGQPIEHVTMEIIKAMAAKSDSFAPGAGHPARLSVTRHAGDSMMEGIGDMLYARINPGVELSEAGRQFRGYSLMECVRVFAESRGINVQGRSKSDLVVMAMHSTSDFPLLFSNLAGKSLDNAYQEEPHTWGLLARQRNLPDFKQATDLVIAADLAPELLLEGGEYRTGTLKEAQATWKLATYARKVCITRQAIINDDLSALERVPELLGRGFRRLESDLVWALISGNAVCSVDGLALFDNAHLNTGTGAIGITGMNSAKKAMRKQKDISGVTVNLTPDYLIVPTDLEATATQFLNPLGYAPSVLAGANGPNIYAGSMRLIVEPRLDGSATQWYVAAGPGRTDGIVYGYLADEPGPTITQVPERDPDGLTLLARFDFGCAVKDYRFIYRSSGV